MGCPDDIRAALEGLETLSLIEFVNAERAFYIEGAGITRDTIETAVKAAGNFEIREWIEGASK